MTFPTFKTKDEVPEPFRSAYVEQDGEWVAKLPDVGKLEQTLATVRSEKKEAEKTAKAASETAADLQRKLDAKEASGADTDKKVSDMLAKWEEDKNAAVKAVQDQLDATNGKLREVTLYDKAKAEFLKAGGRASHAEAALKLKKELLDLAEDRPVVKNEKGEVTTTSIADFWGKEFRKEMPDFFEGTKASGGGAGGYSPPSGSATEVDLFKPGAARAAIDAARAAAQ